ncbi:MAG TPA: hypothetical protein VFQ61_29010 [Polyangiaceae bacterium]|nr:hypothetical protein [Polyangiaceae bacterium]
MGAKNNGLRVGSRSIEGWAAPLLGWLLAACGTGDLDGNVSGSQQTGVLQQSVVEGAARPPQSRPRYTLFEAGPVRPIAVLDSGIVAVTNVPDDRLELFRSARSGVKPCGSVKVGMRPVAVAAVADRLWVVNHLSDSVSILKLDSEQCTAQLEKTLWVGDEPRDIVSATSPKGERFVFVTSAHRGQNVTNADGSYRDPELTEPGRGRADVFVFGVDSQGRSNAQAPLEILTLFTDTPRALAVGNGKVFAAGFMSGNQTAVARYQLVVDRGRQSLAKLDQDGDLVMDASLPDNARVVEGGYPALQGHGRCLSGTTASEPGRDRTDFWMDVCVRTDPQDGTRALEIVRQTAGVVTPECSCTNSLGELQMTPPLIVRFYESKEICGANYVAQLGGCWFEPPHDEQDLAALAKNQRPPGMQAWNDAMAFTLPDRDVFTIDLNQSPPALVPSGEFRHVGTNLLSMAVHPKTGKVFVGNTESRNHVRFEGPGEGTAQNARFANTTVRGHVAESRISVLDPASSATKPLHLNAHIDYSKCCAEAPNAESEQSLAFPVGLAITQKKNRSGQLSDAQDLYVTALGSDKIAVLNTETLDKAQPGQIVQTRRDHIEVAGGPAGLALDEAQRRLYVFTHFTNELVVIDTNSRRELERLKMFTPEPESIVAGRPFLYDARRTSSHGDTACASCHLFGDLDGLAWDLGAPNDRDFENTGPFFARPEFTSAPLTSRFLSVKGPMTTQSLRGMANHGAMHWRGDRRGGLDSTVHAQPDTGAFDEQAAFKAFNVAFPGLNGRATQLTEAEMQHFTDFVLALTYPPNPVRQLDDSLTEGQKRARSRYFGCEITDDSMSRRQCADGRSIEEETLNCNCANPPEFVLGLVQRPAHCPKDPRCTLDVSDFQNTCHGCHTWNPAGNAEFGVDKPGFFGTSGVYTNDSVSHVLKVPHLRNIYQKVGMFGSVQTKSGVGLNNLADSIFGPRQGGLLAPKNAFLGDQIRGFGFTHAGEEDTIFHFFSSGGFARSASPGPGFINDNRGGFEPVLPASPEACFGSQLGSLNQRFIAELAAPEIIQQLQQQFAILTTSTSTPEQRAAAQQVLASFLLSLPPSNPGAVFQRLPLAGAISQLALPLLACPRLPAYEQLAALGCFELKTGAGCADLIGTVRGCALWGATLEQIVPNGTLACRAAGLDGKAEMESLMFAFDSDVKPSVGQQVTLTNKPSAEAQARLRQLQAVADAQQLDLTATSQGRGYVYESGQLTRDDGTKVRVSTLLRKLDQYAPITFTAVPRGEGRRAGIDRDLDGVLDAFDLEVPGCNPH